MGFALGVRRRSVGADSRIRRVRTGHRGSPTVVYGAKSPDDWLPLNLGAVGVLLATQ